MGYRVDTQLLTSSAATVNSIASGFESELAQLKSVVDNTANAWEGPAKDSFLETYDKYQKNMKEFIASLGNYASAMKMTADEEDQLQQNSSSRFRSI